MDSATGRGADWLAAAQDEDGAWRSGTHGVFRDGSALTPHALRALVELDVHRATAQRGAAFAAGLDANRLAYPTYAAADLAVATGHAEWIALLRSRQLRDPQAFPSTGGWAYPAGPLGGAVEANLSATAYALCALADAGAAPDDPAMVDGLAFVLRCRNDDGGFLFGPTDAADNKAGAGVSYGTTTADGLRAMLACGVPRDDPRVAAAVAWLLDRFDPANVPGDFTPARAPLRNANYFYYVDAVTDALTRAGVPRRKWAGAFAAELARRQREDGRWVNDFAAGREDEPIVATAFALRGLRRCGR